MNYEYVDDQFSNVLEEFTLHPQFRPHTGDIITLERGTRFEEFKIVRTVPTNNPNNVKVQYFLRPIELTPRPLDGVEELQVF